MEDKKKKLIRSSRRDDQGYFHLGCIFSVFMSTIPFSSSAEMGRAALIMAVFMLLFTWTAFIAFTVEEISEGSRGHLGRHIEASLAFMWAQLISFAVLFERYGLKADGQLSKLDYLYFSVVTWTTLGYGDITPIGVSRPIAALEAVSGYIYMGIFIAILSVFMIDTFRHNENDTDESNLED